MQIEHVYANTTRIHDEVIRIAFLNRVYKHALSYYIPASALNVSTERLIEK